MYVFMCEILTKLMSMCKVVCRSSNIMCNDSENSQHSFLDQSISNGQSHCNSVTEQNPGDSLNIMDPMVLFIGGRHFLKSSRSNVHL